MNRITLWAVSILAGCAFAIGSADASRLSDLEVQVQALSARLDQVEQREENYRKEVEAQKKLSQDMFLELKKNQADLKTDVQSLREQLNQLAELMKELTQKVVDLEAKFTVQPIQGNTPITTTAMKEAAGGTTENKQLSAAAGSAPTAQALPEKSLTEGYQLGVSYYNEGKYDAARAQFEAFIKANPGSPSSEDAQFKIAECYFQQKDYKRAALEYNNLREKYPKSKKLPAALYKMGLCFERLGKKDAAQTTYKDLIASYPQSPEASQAKVQLDKLQKAKK